MLQSSRCATHSVTYSLVRSGSLCLPFFRGLELGSLAASGSLSGDAGYAGIPVSLLPLPPLCIPLSGPCSRVLHLLYLQTTCGVPRE